MLMIGRKRRTHEDRAQRPRGDLDPLIAEFSATAGATWGPVTSRKHRDDFARFLTWLRQTGRSETVDSLDYLTLLAYVADLRSRPKVTGVWRGTVSITAAAMTRRSGPTLSANTVNAYVRPLRSFAIWLVDEGVIGMDPFRRARRAGSSGLLPSEETPTKGATLDDLRSLEHGCGGPAPLDLRDRAIVAVLVTTAARNSSVRLLRIGDIDFDRGLIRFVRAKGGKTLEIALHPDARAAIVDYLESGRPSLAAAGSDQGYLFLAHHGDGAPLGMNALSLMLTRRYRLGGGGLPYFGSHRIRHATATILVNNGMPLDEVSRYLGHSSTDVTRRYARHTPETLGRRAADAFIRAGLVGP
jgi:integrase